MKLNEFVNNFAAQFEQTNQSEIKADTNFRDLDEWSSLTGLMIIGMVQDEYDKQLKADAFKKCNTVEDVFNLVNSL